jgi:bifunctional DNA-binding transcriptional regulator/antitoxin component of YhaV-PrlF toxin-antitoxin module
MIATVMSQNQIRFPAKLCERDAIEAGQRFEIVRVKSGEYRLVRLDAAEKHGLVDWLLACPEKGFFRPIKSEFTDTL